VPGFPFATEIRVRFAETDAQGVAHNAVYLVWFEVARVEYLERFAGGYGALREGGVEALVTESHVRYGLPARYVIHAVGPVWHGGSRSEPDLLASCYRRALVRQRGEGCGQPRQRQVVACVGVVAQHDGGAEEAEHLATASSPAVR
jgi:O-acetyl-ADP-ribose deacetylase (regulator of RNase III)